MSRRLLGLVGSVTSLVPLTASAATVAVAPANAPAPALSLPLAGLLVLAMFLSAIFVMRRASAKVSAGFAVVAVAAMLTTVSYAITSEVLVEGKDCDMVTSFKYDEDSPPTVLVSGCKNQIKVIELKFSCDEQDVVLHGADPCVVGEILQNDEECALPICMPT